MWQPESRSRRLPPWLKRPIPASTGNYFTKSLIAELGLQTICESARCPNRSECWTRRTATFMILGETCTRPCGFCAVKRGKPESVAADEPERLAEACRRLGLQHVVITSVTRDDLADEGAEHFRRCILAVRQQTGATHRGSHSRLQRPHRLRRSDPVGPARCVQSQHRDRRPTPAARPPQEPVSSQLESAPPREGHQQDDSNQEWIDGGPRRDYGGSSGNHGRPASIGCDFLTLGQYLQPSTRHLPVARFLPPQEFIELGRLARCLGFSGVSSGPFVRSSYHADEMARSPNRRDPEQSSDTGEFHRPVHESMHIPARTMNDAGEPRSSCATRGCSFWHLPLGGAVERIHVELP